MPEYEVYLCHHGVKGMKWGVRRTAAQLGRLVKKGAKKAKSAYDSHREKKKAEKAAEERVRKEKAIRKKPLSKLSETELKERVSRLKLEKEIADLEKQIGEARGTGKSKTSKFMSVVGKEVIKPALIKVARDQLGNYLNGIAGNVVKKGVNDFTDNFNKKHNQNNNKNNQNNNKNNQNNNEKPKTEKPKTEKPKKDDRIVFEGEVVGEGTSRYNPGRSKKKKNNRAKSAPIKAEGWVHDSVSRATSSTAMIVRGDDYIRRLLN